ncbi:MAG: hypothetical protein KDK66_07915 [Deltaproteobacteria bacterium]|nr:hypothetical protein [Deltaproteobacteria bacterium]
MTKICIGKIIDRSYSALEEPAEEAISQVRNLISEDKKSRISITYDEVCLHKIEDSQNPGTTYGVIKTGPTIPRSPVTYHPDIFIEDETPRRLEDIIGARSPEDFEIKHVDVENFRKAEKIIIETRQKLDAIDQEERSKIKKSSRFLGEFRTRVRDWAAFSFGIDSEDLTYRENDQSLKDFGEFGIYSIIRPDLFIFSVPVLLGATWHGLDHYFGPKEVQE